MVVVVVVLVLVVVLVVVVVVVVVVEVVTNPSSLARSPLLRAGSADMVFCIY